MVQDGTKVTMTD